MSQENFPVFVRVTRPDGTTESLRVGTAVREGEGFRLSLGELSIGARPDAPARRPAAASDAGALVFPPYGRSKGAPIVGASIQDLEFYINGCRRTLDDPAKSRWHEKERVLLAALEAEIDRQQGGSEVAKRARSTDYDDELGPPPGDEDIPF